MRVSDPQGVFLTSPEIELDWAPLAWLYNDLHIDRIEADKVRLERLPRLRPGRGGPLLPGFDIEIGKLAIHRFEVAQAVSGRERVGSVAGAATIRAGRAMVDLRLALLDGDRMALKLDAEPDADRFDLDVRALAPADGLLAALTGVKRPIDLTIEGAGSWTRWRGTRELLLSGRSTGSARARRRPRALSPVGDARARAVPQGAAAAADRAAHPRRGRRDARRAHPRWPADAVVARLARGGARRDRPWHARRGAR